MGSYEQTRLLRSTIKWAQKECIKWIREHSNMPKQLAVETFIEKMDDYSTRNLHTSLIFSIAKDVATSILDDMIMKGEAR